MSDKGQVYKKGWDGEYRPAEGLFGNPEANVKRGLLSGEPVAAKDWLGNQKRAADGNPLYESTPDRGAEAAGGLIGLAIILALAVAAAAAWLFAKVVGWWWPRTSASVRRDYAQLRVSLGSVGLCLPAVAGVVLLLGSSLGLSNTSPFMMAGGLIFGFAFEGVVAYVPVRFGEEILAIRAGEGVGREFIGWGVCILIDAFMVWGLMFPRYTYEGVNAFAAILLAVASPTALVAGLVWGLAGRPDWIAWVRKRVRQAPGGSQIDTTVESTADGTPD